MWYLAVFLRFSACKKSTAQAMPLCSVFLLYYHITFSRRKKEVKGNKKSVKNTVGKIIELSTGIKKEADDTTSLDILFST